MATEISKHTLSQGRGSGSSPSINWRKLLTDNNDNTIATAFAEHYCTNHRFEIDSKAWMVWADRRWSYDTHSIALNSSIKRMADDLKRFQKSSDTIASVVKKLSNARSRMNVITILSIEPALCIRHVDLDAHPHIISFPNGAY